MGCVMSVCESWKLRNIMIVDDSATMRLQLKDALVNIGFEVVAEAGNGASAIDALSVFVNTGSVPDCVFIDLEMPGIDGLETSKRIMTMIPDISIVSIVPSYRRRNIVNVLLDAGISGYVVKPFSEKTVFDVLSCIEHCKSFGQKHACSVNTMEVQ